MKHHSRNMQNVLFFLCLSIMHATLSAANLQNSITGGLQQVNQYTQQANQYTQQANQYSQKFNQTTQQAAQLEQTLNNIAASPVTAGTELLLKTLGQQLPQPSASGQMPAYNAQPAPLTVTIKNRSDSVTDALLLAVASQAYYLLNNPEISISSEDDSRSEIQTRINEFLGRKGYVNLITDLINQLKSFKDQDTEFIKSCSYRIANIKKDYPDKSFNYLDRLLKQFQIADYLFSINKNILNYITTFTIDQPSASQSIENLQALLKYQEKQSYNAYFPKLIDPSTQQVGSLKQINNFLKNEGLTQLNLARSSLKDAIDRAESNK